MTKLVNRTTPADLAARCHEIQVGLGTTEVPEFDQLALIGMAVRLALHIRGLSPIPYEVVKLVGYHYLDISLHAARRVVELLAEIEFVKLGTEGKTIKTVLPNVPYYEELYEQLGGYAVGRRLGVRYVLEGSVRKASDKVRIGVQLNLWP